MSPAAPLMSNDVKLPHLLSTNRANKQGTAQRRAPCRKLGAKTRRFTVRGRSRTQTMRFRALHSNIAQQNPRSRVSYCGSGRKDPVSTCPVPSIWAFSDRKNDNMSPSSPFASPKNPSTPQGCNALPETAPRRIGAQKIRGTDSTSDSNARLSTKR